MRKFICGLTFIMLFVGKQLIAKNGFDYGVKIGITSSTFNHTDKTPFGENLDFIDGYSINPSIGLFAIILKTTHLDLELEATYLHKSASESIELIGYRIDDLNTPVKIRSRYELGSQYIKMGINAHPKIQLRPINIYTIVGPSVDYLLKTSIGHTEDDLKRFQIGYNLGIGVDLQKSLKKEITVELKYQSDFTPFFESHAKYWNRVFMLSIGIGV